MTARILVVDDIAANLRLLEAKLVAEYYEVALASSGPEALDVTRRWLPDVILLDVMMPGMDGYEVCRRLKADPATQHIPVVMVTALTDPAERVEGLEAGADDFLSKPVDDATLFARLRALLRVKQVLDAWRLRAETARALGFEPPPGPPPGVRGARVLLLDAEQAEAAEIAGHLAEDGILPTLARHPDTALEALERGDFDLAVLRLDEEGSAGLRIASRLRAAGSTRDLPVLVVADAAQRGIVLRAFDIGANDHVLRPVDPHELRARVRNQIRRKRYQEGLRAELDRSLEMAVTDPLTGLRNRRYVLRHLESLLLHDEAAVLLLDVDRFKRINDTYGHATGDAVLREIGDRLRSQLRAADVAARYGGEEFMVVLAGAPQEYAGSVAERLRQAMADTPVVVGELKLDITISIGLAVGQPGEAVMSVVEAADAALYRAKAAGRNRVEVAEAGLPDGVGVLG